MNNEKRQPYINRKGGIAVNRSNGISLLGFAAFKASMFALDFQVMPKAQEIIREYPELIPLGLFALASLFVASSLVRPKLLKKVGRDTGIASTGIYNVITYISPWRKVNAAVAYGTDVLLGIVGTSPAAMAATINMLATGQVGDKIGERIGAVVTGSINLVVNTAYLLRVRKQKVVE